MYLCIVFRQIERRRESAFSLFRERELGHFTKVQSRNKDNCPLGLYSISCDIHQVESQQDLIYFVPTKRESKPYVRDGEKWMAPLFAVIRNKINPPDEP